MHLRTALINMAGNFFLCYRCKLLAQQIILAGNQFFCSIYLISVPYVTALAILVVIVVKSAGLESL